MSRVEYDAVKGWADRVTSFVNEQSKVLAAACKLILNLEERVARLEAERERS